ncbi:AK6 [Lepeophtheirus salmonis]|uniref:AK6 n=1 Tax=Lepeophtheirus salmonis TaxID=72036 RepID=A0A7R8HEA4_LEPSM|nr:AK6 [Lepeophtheirus salmonis]CAF3041039.1 AK6 [Lepeophtheirus salmonis]
MSDSDCENRPCKKRVKTKRAPKRNIPNILITGTPGTGKSRLSKCVSEACPEMKWINIGEYAKEKNFMGTWDDKGTCIHWRAETSILYDRLEGRGYKDAKLEDNVQCEIFQTILDEAKESYEESIVFELSSNDEKLDINGHSNFSKHLFILRKYNICGLQGQGLAF